MSEVTITRVTHAAVLLMRTERQSWLLEIEWLVQDRREAEHVLSCSYPGRFINSLGVEIHGAQFAPDPVSVSTAAREAGTSLEKGSGAVFS
jgi:hypothetical protein